MVKKISVNVSENWFAKLAKTIIGSDEEKREISVVSLKILVSRIPAENAASAMKKVIQVFLEGVVDSNQGKAEAYDVLSDVLARFGSVLVGQHEELYNTFVSDLNSQNSTIRKKSISCLSSLAPHASDTLFQKLVREILKGLQTSKAGEEPLRMYMLCCNSVAKTSGYRFGRFLNDLFPILVNVSGDIVEMEKEVEIRENIMQTFESLVFSCVDEIQDFVDFIVLIAKEYLEYDPNYHYDASEEEEETNEKQIVSIDLQFGADEDGNISDDDDNTWKVRKSAAKCLTTLIKLRPSSLRLVYQELCSPKEHTLISCFREREEGVKLDILETFQTLLKQTISQREDMKFLQEVLKLVMNRLLKQFPCSLKVKQAIFQVLTHVILVLSGKLETYIGPLVPAICFALSDPKTTSPLKLEALSFLEQLLVLHSPEHFKDHYSKLSSAVFVCVQDRFYKVISSSLRVCGEFVKIVQTFRNSNNMLEFEKYLGELYRNIQDRLQLKDIDKDVKEAAIEAMGILVSRLGKSLKFEQNPLPTLLEKLSGEVTKLTTCRTLALIAASPDHLDMSSSFLREVITELAGYLRKNIRPLRLAAVLTLTEFVKGYGKDIDGKLYFLLISEIQGLLSVTRDTDLHLTQLVLDLVVRILEVSPKSAGEIKDQIMPTALQLLETPTLQGGALLSLSSLLRQMLPTVSFANQLSAFLVVSQRLKGPITKQVYTNIGKCIATLVQSTDSNQQEVKKTIEKFAGDIKRNSQQDEGIQLLALYTLGEIGLVHGLLSTYYGSLKGDLESCFESPSDEVKAAASTCLGNVAVGNLEQYLPSVLQGIGDDKKKYLLLHSLKEIIVQAPAEEISKYIADILPLLFENCDKTEEGIRNVVSECLGKLACVNYGKVMGELKARLDKSSNEQIVSTIVSSVRYTISEKAKPFDAQLKQDIAKFLSKFLINSNRNDPDSQQHHHKVRRACVLLLTSVMHTKPTLILSHLSSFLPGLYAGCVVDKSLIKNIDMGPFKVEQDDGLELRKSVYECMDTLLDVAIKNIDANKFAVQLPLGLSDPNSDIKMLTHIMIQKLCESVPSAVLHVADSMVDPLKVTLTERPKENAVPTEKEKVADQIRSAMKAVVAISLVKGIQDSVKFNDLLAKIIKPSPTLEALFATLLLNNNSVGSGIAGSNFSISSSSK